MQGVLFAKAAVFFKLHPIGVLLLVLLKVIVTLLAVGARQRNSYPYYAFCCHLSLQFLAFCAGCPVRGALRAQVKAV
jgi:hypothetical protein